MKWLLALSSWLLVFAAGALSRANSEEPKATRPNIVFILSDDQRYDSLGIVGNKEIKTPNLDSLGKEGIVFTHATVCVSLCAPSRASLLTGLLPHQHGYYSNKSWSKEAAHGFAAPTGIEMLRESGYRTVLIGKWHLECMPWKVGFSEIRTWMPQGADNYVDPKLAHGKSDKIKETPGHVTELFTNDALEFLRVQAKVEKPKRPAGEQGPFFLWLAYTAPHTPQKPVPDRINALYSDYPPDARPPGFPPGETTVAPWTKYYGAISHLDEQIGRVLKAIDDAGLRENTVVFFLGDNGWMMGSHGYHGKINAYDESIRVPLIVRAPKPWMNWKGQSPILVSSLDLTPTWLELGGLKAPADWPGTSIVSQLAAPPAFAVDSGKPAPPFRSDVFCEFEDEKEWPGDANRCIRTQDWKYILRPQRSEKELKNLNKNAAKSEEEHDRKPPDLAHERLYNLKADPHELKDLMGEPGVENALEMMRGRMKEWMKRTDDPAMKWLDIAEPAPKKRKAEHTNRE